MNHQENRITEPDRVRRRTDPEVLDRIEDKLEQNVRYYSTQGPEALSRRIEELEQEWDMERILETNASILALTGAFFGLFSRKWLLLTCGVTGFLFQHAVTGWCPPVPFFRRRGVRTRSEIDREKFALKAIRGDFKSVQSDGMETGNLARQIMQTVNA